MGLPVEINNLMLGSLGGYTVGRSLRFRSSASAYLNRTPASAGNRKTWTWSGWVKRGKLGSAFGLIASPTASAISIGIDSTDVGFITIAGVGVGTTTAVFRDPSAWYHVVIAFDTTQATSANRVKFYVNNVQHSLSNTLVSLNTDYNINSNTTQEIGTTGVSGSTTYFDGYLAEVNFIDGQALTPSSFGAYDTNGVWQPKKYSGTYGTNGFYLPFSNTTSTTTLVADSSGNGNNWTPNNISLTAGTTYDSMIDSPTNAAGNSNGIGNYAVLNPIQNYGYTVSNANLIATVVNAASPYQVRATIGVPSGKYYFEYYVSYLSGTGGPIVGVVDAALSSITSNLASSSQAWLYYSYNGQKYNGSGTAYGSTWTQGDTIGVALDMDAGTIVFYKNNVSQGTAFSNLSGKTIQPVIFHDQAGTLTYDIAANFGQRPFSYTPPSGYKALNTYNLPAPSIANGAQHFDIVTRAGTGASVAISSYRFAPDFVWIKSRTNAYYHKLLDKARGANKVLSSNATDAESTETQGLMSFDTNGYTLGTSSDSTVNNAGSGQTYVDWAWKGGGTGVTNTSGTITSTVSANTTAGFSIVTYTGTGAGSATVGHGLGVAPNFVIVKQRDAGGALYAWNSYHSSLGEGAYIQLNTTSAAASDIYIWSNTAPSSTVITLGSSTGSYNQVNNFSGCGYVAYCFAAVRGYSAFGSYTGNGSTDGAFVYTGFRPRWIMVKRSDGVESWLVWDSSRSTYNLVNTTLFPNLANDEGSIGTNITLDILSNGFKLRNSTGAGNISSATYVYACFSEHPFNLSRAR